MEDPHRLIASLQASAAKVEVDTVMLCFLVALRAHTEAVGSASLSEDTLYEVFERVLAICEPEAQNPRKTATHALQRLRDQRILARVDGAGLYRPGEFAMTRLGAALVDFFVTDEALTRESLQVLTRALASQLAETLAVASSAQGEDDWKQVVHRLGIAVGDLVAGIERRQRGLDQQQEQIRTDITELLGRDWFGAVEDCERLLVEVANTLEELTQVLLQDMHLLQAQLQDLDLRAEQAGASHAASEARRVSEQIERVLAVAQARQAAWSEYYQFVHRYLRDVVRLDPNRQTSQRLRDQLAAWPDEPFYLVVLTPEPIHLLKSQEEAVVRPPVTRKRDTVETPIELLSPEDERNALVARVEGALAENPTRLSTVLRRVLPDVDPQRRYREIGRVVALVTERMTVHREREPEWMEVLGFEVQEWALEPREKP